MEQPDCLDSLCIKISSYFWHLKLPLVYFKWIQLPHVYTHEFTLPFHCYSGWELAFPKSLPHSMHWDRIGDTTLYSCALPSKVEISNPWINSVRISGLRACLAGCFGREILYYEWESGETKLLRVVSAQHRAGLMKNNSHLPLLGETKDSSGKQKKLSSTANDRGAVLQYQIEEVESMVVKKWVIKYMLWTHSIL